MSARFDFVRSGQWDSINEQVASTLRQQGYACASATITQSFFGVGQALFQTIHALRRLFLTRSTILMQSHASPIFQQLAHGLSGDGIKIQWITAAQMHPPFDWLQKAAQDVLVCLTVQDHPVFDVIMNHPEFYAELRKLKVLSLRLAHSSLALSKLEPLQATEIALHGFFPDLAVLFAGDRYRCRPVEMESFAWNSSNIAKIQPARESRAEIQEFEQQLIPDFTGLTRPKDTERLYHRSVLVNEHIDGSAFCELLTEKLGITLSAPGLEGRLESLSPLRWRDIKLDDWLAEHGLAANVRRGSVAFDQTLIRPGFADLVRSTLSELKALQKG